MKRIDRIIESHDIALISIKELMKEPLSKTATKFILQTIGIMISNIEKILKDDRDARA